MIPVIAIDGPSASGKGSVAQRLAAHLSMHYLDSGALYRIVAARALRSGVMLDDESALTMLARDLDVRFEGDAVLLDGQDESPAIRSEAAGSGASKVAALPGVRAILLQRQRAFRQAPGLVADGRDMGSVVFPDARLKVFLTASPETRAHRRHKQLIDKGISANIAGLLRELRERDQRDTSRAVAPLVQLPDARLLDTTNLGIDAAVMQVAQWYREVCA
jgi:CMP/dCMP kinase